MHDLLNSHGILSRKLYALVAGEKRTDFHHIVKQDGQIASGHGEDMIDGKIAEDTRFNLYLLGIHFPFHLIAGLKLNMVHHTCLTEHLNR